MKSLIAWLQNNPLIILVMFIISVLSSVMTIFLGWQAFYSDYLSKPVLIPVWLIVVVSTVILFLVIHFRSKEISSGPAKELEIVEGKSFGVQQVVMDGKNFVRCKFDGTELIYNGIKNFSLGENKFLRFRFTFSQFAANTIAIIEAMYKDPAFRPIVDQTFENIKKGQSRRPD